MANILLTRTCKGCTSSTLKLGASKPFHSRKSLRRAMSFGISSSAWFPDGTDFVANAHPATEDSSCLVFPDEQYLDRSRQHGGAPHKLRDHAMAWSVSPDGSLISFGTDKGKLGEREIWLMDSDGGAGPQAL